MGWQLLAVVSAVAAGVTSVFAKAGLQEVPSHLGNAVRTAIVLALSLTVLWWSGEHQKTGTLNGRAWLFLALSGLATAVSWVAYFKALVDRVGDAGDGDRQSKPRGHDDPRHPVPGRTPELERRHRRDSDRRWLHPGVVGVPVAME